MAPSNKTLRDRTEKQTSLLSCVLIPLMLCVKCRAPCHAVWCACGYFVLVATGLTTGLQVVTAQQPGPHGPTWSLSPEGLGTPAPSEDPGCPQGNPTSKGQRGAAGRQQPLM